MLTGIAGRDYNKVAKKKKLKPLEINVNLLLKLASKIRR